MKTKMNIPESVLTKQQYKSFGPRPISGYADGAAIWAHVRHDDECGNGHNTFALTATVREPGRRDIAAGGCMHDEIAAAFPELAPLIKWHLCSTDGPLHYLANTVYLAGNRDYNGHAAGEPSRWEWVIKWNSSPIEWRGPSQFIKWLRDVTLKDFEALPISHGEKDRFEPKWTLGGYDCRWHECPFDSSREALQFMEAMKGGYEVVKVPVAWSEGKARELNAAREAAIWPEATDEELSVSPEELKAALLARLPALMVEFKKAVESLGFVY